MEMHIFMCISRKCFSIILVLSIIFTSLFGHAGNLLAPPIVHDFIYEDVKSGKENELHDWLQSYVRQGLVNTYSVHCEFISGIEEHIQQAIDRLKQGEKEFQIHFGGDYDTITIDFSLTFLGLFAIGRYNFDHNQVRGTEHHDKFYPFKEYSDAINDYQILARYIFYQIKRLIKLKRVKLNTFMIPLSEALIKLFKKKYARIHVFERPFSSSNLTEFYILEMRLESDGVTIDVINDLISSKIAAKIKIPNQIISAVFKKKDRLFSFLGQDIDPATVGIKASNFRYLKLVHGCYFPEGVVIPVNIVNGINSENINELVDLVLSYFDPEYPNVVVRASPVESMPGKLTSIIDLRDRNAVKKAILDVKKSWNSNKAKQYRELNNIPEDSGMGIIIQRMVYGDLTEKSCSGVFCTRDPNSGKKGLYGRFVPNARGAELMQGKIKGYDINLINELSENLVDYFSGIGEGIEKYKGYPQEIEFVREISEDPVLSCAYVVQTRDMKFSPQGEILFLKEKLEKGEINEMQYATELEELQKKLQSRVLYKVKDTMKAQAIFRGDTSTPGALQGRLVFDSSKIDLLRKETDPIILVMTEETRDAMLDVLFTIPKVAVLTTYGNSFSHEAVITRAAGISSIINIHAKVENNRIVYEDGTLQEDDFVLIDGHNDYVFQKQRDPLEVDTIVQDASFGINIPEFRKSFTAYFFKSNGKIKKVFTYKRFLLLNKLLQDKYLTIRATGDKRAAFIMNLKKHFAHGLLLVRAEELGKSILDVKRELHLMKEVVPSFKERRLFAISL